jgi:hypothetical protein
MTERVEFDLPACHLTVELSTDGKVSAVARHRFDDSDIEIAQTIAGSSIWIKDLSFSCTMQELQTWRNRASRLAFLRDSPSVRLEYREEVQLSLQTKGSASPFKLVDTVWLEQGLR